MLECNLLLKLCFLVKVCPVILGLTEAESDDLRTEAVALLSKVSNEKFRLKGSYYEA